MMQVPLENKIKKRRRYMGDQFKLMMLRLKRDSFKVPVYEVFIPVRVLSQIVKKDPIKKVRKLRLNELKENLHNFFSNIVYVQSMEADINGIKPWIISTSPIELKRLHFFFSIWLDAYYPDLSVTEEEFVQRSNILYFDFECTDNGTSVIRCNGEKEGYYESPYNLLTYYLHSLLPFFEMELNNGDFMQHMTFVRSFREDGPEWVTTESFGKYPWSVRIRMTLQTIPADSHFYAYFHVEIIRWSSSTFTRDPKKKLHVYYRYPRQMSGENANLHPFLRMEFNKRNWSPFLKHLLAAYGHEDLLPGVNDFKSRPLDFLAESNRISVGVPYGAHIKGKHFASSGSAPIDRYLILDNIRKQLTDKWNGWERDYITVHRIKPRILAKGLELIAPEATSIEIYYQTPEFLDAALTEIENKLGGSVTVSSFSIFELWGKNVFHIEKKESNRDQKSELNAFERRISSRIIRGGRTFCLVELEDKDQFEGGDVVDPKPHIRTIFAKNERLTQFITPFKEGEDASHRLSRGVLDLCRQMGIISRDIDRFEKVPTAYIGIYFKTYQDRSTVPVLVSVFNNQTYLYVIGETEKWIPYQDGQVLLGKLQMNFYKLPINVGAEIFHALKRFELQFEPKHLCIYVLTQNARHHWKWLQNGRINTDGIGFQDGNPERNPRWSLVRLRDEEGHEAPEWIFYGKSSHEDKERREIPQALQSGVLLFDEMTAFCVATKPDVMKDMPYHLTRFERDNKPFRKETALEMFIPWCAETVDPERLFSLTLRLRNVSLQYDDYTLLPLPLHLAKKATEYIFKEE